MIDCGKNSPSKYRTEADNNVRQTCFFSQKKKDRVFDRFTSHNLEPGNRDSLIFKIELSDKNSIKEEHLPYNQLLSKGNCNVQVKDDNRCDDRRNFQGKSAENEPDITRCYETEQKPENDHDFSFLEEANQNKENVMSRHLKRRIKPYKSSRIKARNFLSNISYTGVKSEDFADNNFTFGTITLLTKNINPFSLERKIVDEKN